MKYSPSALKTYETCPRQYKAIYVDRSAKRERTPEADWGNSVHSVVEARLQSSDYKPPPGHARHVRVVDKLKKNLTGAQVYTEQSLGVDEHFQPEQYKKSKYRGKIDYLGLKDQLAYCIDWKTGKVRNDPFQLEMYSVLVFVNFPDVDKIIAGYVWLKYNQTKKYTYTREDFPALCAKLITRARTIENDYVFAPKQSGLCRKHCPVLECPYNGRT